MWAEKLREEPELILSNSQGLRDKDLKRLITTYQRAPTPGTTANPNQPTALEALPRLPELLEHWTIVTNQPASQQRLLICDQSAVPD